MKTNLLSQDDPQAFDLAVKLIRAGEVIGFPTDTVYGIGARADSESAISKIYQIKARVLDKPVPVMVAFIEQLESLVDHIPDAARRLAEHFWPGPLTIVLPKSKNLPGNLTRLPGVGIRIPDHPFILGLLKICGPMAVTSANLSGKPETRQAGVVLEQLNGLLPLVVDGGDSPGGVPSTVVDLTVEPPRILREGPLSAEMIARVLSTHPGH